MTDIFFSYSAKDRDRVRPIHDALSALGFDIFWDQQVPTGKDWDTWIREQLAAARCTVVFWSLASVASDNVRHEATVAKHQGKLVPAMLDPLRVEQFPMGLFNTQAARLIDWSGAEDDREWQKLLSEIESKAMPRWAGRRLASLDAALRAETRRRETAEAKEDAAETQLAQEIGRHGQLRRERERAQAEADAARAELAGLKEALSAAQAEAQSARVELEKSKQTASAAQTAAETARTDLAALEEVSPAAPVRSDEDLAGREPPPVARAPARVLLIGGLIVLGMGAGGLYVWQQQQVVGDEEGRKAEQLEAARMAAEERSFRMLQDTSLMGQLLANERNHRSVAECLRSCARYGTCVGFEFRSAGDFCYLYRVISNQYLLTGAVSGRRD